MRPFFLATCLIGLSLAEARAADVLADARERWLRGNWAEARSWYESAAKDPKHAIAAAIGLSRVRESEGNPDAALAEIDRALKASPNDTALLARHAELEYRRGRLEEALQSAEAAIAAQPDQFPARWIRANIKLDRGELAAADSEFRWFVRTYTARDQANDPIRDADTLYLVARAGAINARWHNLSDQFRFILNEVLNDALRAEPAFWPAEHFAGTLLLEKYNRGEALTAFDKALAINPRAAPALVGKGRVALQQFKIKDAEKLAEQASSVDPSSIEALQLLADVQFLCGEDAHALRRLEQARKINPADEGTLGRLAACYFLRNRKPEFDNLCSEVSGRDAKPGRFWFTLASRLDDRRWYDDASSFYRRALEAWPHMGEAKIGLGMLALRLGQEDDARSKLTGASQADPFNVRVANSLKVLRHLDGYQTIRTPHFLIRFDAKTDGALGRYMTEALEREYERLAAQFRFQFAEPILVEVFSRHDMFSGRTTGLPDLHTVGATTGRTFSIVSPKGQGVPKPFSWGRVIRHELVHVFNLEQTKFQVPHWLTEGLAVRNENIARPPEWLRLLAERTAAGTLFDLSTVNSGFLRPRTPAEWTLAYCQAHLYVEYLTQAHGEQVIAKLLAAYRDGLDTAGALRRAGAGELPEIEKGYRNHVKQVLTQARCRPPEATMPLPQWQAAVERSPDDVDLAARLAEQYWKRRRTTEAGEMVERVLQKQPKNGLALFVKAQLLLGTGEDEHAVQLLEMAAALDPPEPKALKSLGRLSFDAGKMSQGEAAFRRGRQAEPGEPGWLEELARVYKQTGDMPKRIAVLEELAPIDADDLPVRRELAERLAAAQRWPDAERWAREALEIDVEDAVARDVLFRALEALGKQSEAQRLRKLLTEP